MRGLPLELSCLFSACIAELVGDNLKNVRTKDAAAKEAVRVVFAKETGDAINEFERNNELLATAFPWVFLSGKVPSNNGKFSIPERRCLLLRYSHKTEREPSLLFLAVQSKMAQHLLRGSLLPTPDEGVWYR